AQGREVPLAWIRAGGTFGEEVLAGAPTRTLYAEAIEPTRVQVVGRAQLTAWAGRPRALLALARGIWSRLAGGEERLENLASRKVPGRLSAALAHFAEQEGQMTPQGTRLPSRLTQQTLADYIGARRETVTLVLGELAEAGLVRRDPAQPRAIVIP